MSESEYIYLLSHMPGITYQMSRQLLQQFGSATAVFDNRDALPDSAHLAIEAHLATARERMEKEYAFCAEKDIRILTYDAPDYPKRLRHTPEAPLTLFYKGTAQLNAKRAISIVGTRKISEYGKSVCQNLCQEIKALLPDCLVVSGLAYGVDIHSHRACLQNSLPTVGVLAHGLDRIYPTLHLQTARCMMEQGGGLLTEYVTGTNPDKGNFVRRNRIVAGITDATIVVESAEQGGSLITARLAQNYGRKVLAIPGRIYDPHSAGCNRLIRTGDALMLTSAYELLEAMGWQSTPAKIEAPTLFPELDLNRSELERKILAALQERDEWDKNELARHLGESVTDIATATFTLEMDGLLVQMGGNHMRRA